MKTTTRTIAAGDRSWLAHHACGAGASVVWLHGLADHGRVWRGAMEALGDRVRSLAPDLPGHGESGKPAEPGAYAAAVVAADLEAWAERLELGAVPVVAHSWAAKVALVWARQAPGRIGRLVLVDPFFVNRLPGVLRPTLPLLYRMLPFLRAMGPFASREAAVAVARGLKQYRGFTSAHERAFLEGLSEAPDGTWRSRFAVAARNGVFDDMLRSDGLTAPLETPTTLLLPEQGLNRTRWQLSAYRRHLPALAIQRIPGNHWPHLVEPAAFHRAIADALRLPPPRTPACATGAHMGEARGR